MVQFNREDRYVVIKRSDLEKIPNKDVRKRFIQAVGDVNEHSVRVGQRKFVVIEHDWPEYELVWAMIEARAIKGEAPDEEEMARALTGVALLEGEDGGQDYTEDEFFLLEHAEQRGFRTLNGDATVYGCTLRQLVTLVTERGGHIGSCADGCPEDTHPERATIQALVEIIDRELMPHIARLPVQRLDLLNETLIAARKLLEGDQ